MFTAHHSYPCGWRERATSFTTALTCASACALLLTMILAFSTPVARADGGVAQFSIRPVVPSSSATAAPYFVFDLQAGATVHDQARITNTGTARGSVALYPVDATTGQTSGVVYRSQQDPRTDVGAWVMVGASQLTLEPQQSQIVAFTVTVPASARPGQHVGGLVAENLALQNGSGSSGSSGMQVNIQHLSIVAVQVNLPGSQAEQMAATGIQAGGQHNYQIIFLGLRNTGTQMLKPTGALHVTDTRGRQLKVMELTLDTVLPQTAIDYPVYVDGQALGPGHYKGVLSLTYGTPQQTLSRAFDFEVTAASLQQVFGSKAPNSPPSLLAGGGPGGILLILAIVGGVALLLLVGLGACIVFVPGLRERAHVPFQRR
jgi:WxL interacting protein linking bacterial and host surfaces